MALPESFTVASYNCGALPNGYDWLRAAAMEMVIKERVKEDSNLLRTMDEIQQLMYEMRFGSEDQKGKASEKWAREELGNKFHTLTLSPNEEGSVNKRWFDRLAEFITPYNVQPPQVTNPALKIYIDNRIKEVLGKSTEINDFNRFDRIHEMRVRMAQRIFSRTVMQKDIICLQEANLLKGKVSILPSNYDSCISDIADKALANGVAWKHERFELVEDVGPVDAKGYVVLLRDKRDKKIVAVASGHLTGCDPFNAHRDPETGEPDSKAGDKNLLDLMERMAHLKANVRVIGMDSNVASTHPRLSILSRNEFSMDANAEVTDTCGQPNLLLNAGLDWIAARAHGVAIKVLNLAGDLKITGTKENFSDHKPVAAKISFTKELKAPAVVEAPSAKADGGWGIYNGLQYLWDGVMGLFS